MFKKNMKKAVAAVATVAMVASMAACGSKGDNISANVTPTPSNTETETQTSLWNQVKDLSYNEKSEVIYNEVLGEFYDYYQKAFEAETISERYALMAVAEAKLLEQAIMLPLTTKGGNYAIGKTAPYTADFTLWGNDYERYHNVLVTTEFITTEDRNEMKAKWAELKGTGTYESWAKDFLKSKGYTLKDSYSYLYTSDPSIWDVLATSQAVDSEAIINTYDGLLEYDCEGTLKPALAESYEVSEDQLTYTFHLRKDATWVDSQGRFVANVTADDFVAGLQHMCDAEGGLEYLIQGIIVNASEYIADQITDFSKVGVKAVDDYTLQYTLEAPCPYFTTMLGYGVFAPMNRAYYTSQGGKFGEEFDSSAATYLYGKTPDNIAYCGPYLVTNCTEKSTIVFKANPSYYNKDKINLKTITWLFYDGSDSLKPFNDLMAGTIDNAGLNASAIEVSRQQGIFDKYAYVSLTDATSYMGFFNVNRAAYANFNDSTAAVSSQTESDQNRTHEAMLNLHFRRAVICSVDKAAYNAQQVGEDLKNNSLRNAYTPYNFVSLPEDCVITIDGKETKFEANTFYGEIMQAQLDADGFPVKVYDPSADGGAGNGDGYDGWFNPTYAVSELKLAAEELAKLGVEVSKSNPIYIDVLVRTNDSNHTNQMNTFKKSVEETLGGAVIVNLVECPDRATYNNAGYFPEYGYDENFDIYTGSGWGPDYGDPQTYLDTMLPDGNGYMVKNLGIY